MIIAWKSIWERGVYPEPHEPKIFRGHCKWTNDLDQAEDVEDDHFVEPYWLATTREEAETWLTLARM